MKKVFVIIIVATVLIMGLSDALGGDVSQCKRIIGESSIYTSEDINKAMDIVEKEFKKSFNGCELYRLEYDENYTDADPNTIVLESDFYVKLNGGDGSLEPDSNYNDCQWILEKNENGKWMITDAGYA